VKTTRLTIADPVGLHARPAALFVKLCNQFASSIRLRNLTEASDWVNAKSILSLLTAGVKQNDSIEIEADGIDEEAALSSLQALVHSDFAAEL
jgi:phosphotransferase system HPr (HPr) family protein